MRKVIFDAFAVVAWLQGEAGRPFVEGLLRQVQADELWGGICSINIGEVYYSTLKKRGPDVADMYFRLLTNLRWEIIPATNEIVWSAARLKAIHRISYADAFALACAQAHEAELVTNDPELRDAPHGVSLRWESE